MTTELRKKYALFESVTSVISTVRGINISGCSSNPILTGNPNTVLQYKSALLTTSDALEYLLWPMASKAIHLMGLFSLSPKQW